MNTLAFALTGDYHTNSRAVRQVAALTNAGYIVTVLHLGQPSVGPTGSPKIVPVPRPAGSGPTFFFYVHRAFSAAAQGIEAEIFHASDLYSLPAMARAAQAKGERLSYDARELYPYVAATRHRPWARLFWRTVERKHIASAHPVLTVSPGIAQHLQTSYGIDAPTVVLNVPARPQAINPVNLRSLLGIDNNHLLVMHQGQMRPDRGCDVLLAAASRLKTVDLVFMGSGPLERSLRTQASEFGSGNRVHFLRPVPPADVLHYTAGADLGATLLEDTCLNHRLALPNKLFEYIAAGLPVLASNLPEIASIVRKFNVGQLVDPGSVDCVYDALVAASENTEQRSRWAANSTNAAETFNWDTASQPFLDAFSRL